MFTLSLNTIFTGKKYTPFLEYGLRGSVGDTFYPNACDC